MTPAETARLVAEVDRLDAQRLAGLDPLVRLVPAAVEDGATVLVAAGGGTVGVAALRAPGSVWVAPRVQSLALRRGADDARGVAEVLDRWESEVLRVGPDDRGVSASVQVAALDDAVVAPLVARHFGRSVVLAVRRTRPEGLASGAVVSGRAGVVVRTADADDLDLVVHAEVAVHTADRAWGFVPEVADLQARVRADLVEELEGGQGWAFVAEDPEDGRPLGVVQVLTPDQSGWATASVRAEPAAYLALAWVEPAARTHGVGRALVAAAHRHAADEGVSAILLHHAAASPRSGPFWARHGYRPLISSWARRPAVRR